MDLSQLVYPFELAMAATTLLFLLGVAFGIRMDEAPPKPKSKPKPMSASEMDVYLS